MAERTRPPLGLWLAETRKRKRFSGRELADASGLSGGYISQLEIGYDPRTGKVLEPTPKLLRMLAVALAEGDFEQEATYYRTMMGLAGYLPPEYFPELVPRVPPAFERAFTVEEAAAGSNGPGLARMLREFLRLEMSLNDADTDVVLDVAEGLRRRRERESGSDA